MGVKHNEGHPSSSDRTYDDDEAEFLRAMEDFKRVTGRRFPTWTEALRVCKSLGYAKSDIGPA